MILVVAEQKDGKLNRASWEAIAAAQQLVDATGASSGPVTVVVVGHNLGGVATELAAADATGVLVADAEALAVYTPEAYAQALDQVINHAKAQYVVFPHTYQARDYV